jgi:hypothetical protein
MTIDFKVLSDDDLVTFRVKLNAELEERTRARLAAEKEKRSRTNKAILDNRDLFLSLMEHSRTSCSDHIPTNGYMTASGQARCSKCALMELDESTTDIEVIVSIEVRRVWEDTPDPR